MKHKKVLSRVNGMFVDDSRCEGDDDMKKEYYCDTLRELWREEYRFKITNALGVEGLEDIQGYMYWIYKNAVVFSEKDDCFKEICHAIRMRQNYEAILLTNVIKVLGGKLSACYITLDRLHEIRDNY